MNRIPVMTIVVCLMIAGGCGKEAPRANQDGRTQTASEARQIDERSIAERLDQQKSATDDKGTRDRQQAERNVKLDALRGVGRRWNDALTEATKTGRSDIGGPMEKMQAAKRDAEAVSVDDCTAKARDTLLSSMTVGLDAYNLFRQQSGPVSDAVSAKLQDAIAQLGESDRQLAACSTVTN
jgi:hypothetical protein